MAGAPWPHVAVIGGGFCGLAAAWELGRRGVRATVLERDAEIGGLVGSFPAGGTRIEKFYHHWFTNDVHVMELIRGRGGRERLACYRGGFAALADRLAQAIRDQGGEIRTGVPVSGSAVDAGRVVGVVTPEETLAADAVIATPALPIVADLVAPHAPGEYVDGLRRIRYLANVCVVLELDRSLSDIYWLNVNDPGFPFVGVIEHTNFEPASTYAGRHIVYLSRYLSEGDALCRWVADMSSACSASFLRGRPPIRQPRGRPPMRELRQPASERIALGRGRKGKPLARKKPGSLLGRLTAGLLLPGQPRLVRAHPRQHHQLERQPHRPPGTRSARSSPARSPSTRRA